ncbi:MAG: DNA-directed DNA polymerase alpha catalytic subunit pol1 [Alyxoria varia]|nr:MAG: DNA-directed DNA polymerase alpha catalytic subunit pol1 [Alyxoria varia]
MVTKAQRLAELRALRASGKTRLSTYEVEDATNLYDEVNEEDYKKVVRNRLDRDDFVVDDNGRGYADDGREDWNEQQGLYDSDSQSEDELPARGKAAKRKREEETENQKQVDEGISKYFNANMRTAASKPKPIATADDTAFMQNLLGDVNINIPSKVPAPPRKAVRQESRRKVRVLSPAPCDKNPIHEPVHDLSTSDEPAATLKTPPLNEIDDLSPLENESHDAVMGETQFSSSPVTNAVERKNAVQAKQGDEEENDDEDMMEVAQVTARAVTSAKSVNVSASRPAPKAVKTEYPTPESSSPTRPPAEEVDASSWNRITSKLNVVQATAATETIAPGKVPYNDAIEEDGSLRFFWFDYTELNGSLLLFGKVKNKKTGDFVSCFVKIDNIMRKLYFLPRERRIRAGKVTGEEVEMGAVYEEVGELMSKISQNSKKTVEKYKIKPCFRKYAFEMPDVPREAEYLKLLYPYENAPVPPESKGETFSHVFGTNTSLFEQFVLWKNIMGPCWLHIEDADFSAVNNASWCKLELQVARPNVISPLGDSDNLEAPPLTMMSISLRTTMSQTENKQEILMASARIYENLSLSDTTPPDRLPCKTFTIMRPVEDSYPPGFKSDTDKHKGTVKLEKSEPALLSLFMTYIQRFDPDVLVGHRLDDLDYSILLSRLKDRKTPGWHRIGRLRRSAWPQGYGKGGGSFFTERQIAAGRLLCDLANDQGKSLMTKCQSWSLAEMCELVLGKVNIRREIDNEAALKTWARSREGLMNYMRHCEADTYFIAAIAIKVQMLPLTKVLTNLAGNSWARTLTGTRAERNEYILLHEFHRNRYICPDKTFGKGKQKAEDEPAEGEENVDSKKKDKFKGGLVFEPEKGLYDRVILVMDFNSLYPSIIQEYNICFTTVDRTVTSDEDENVPDIPRDQDQGILPKLIATLVNRRREVKKLMKDKTATTDQLASWDIKQLALKLTANSMYGCLGYTKSRFYARPLAMLTTFKGREILRSTKELAETTQLQVIYGDTDSVMINTNMDNIQDAIKVGNEFKRAVNERYRLLEIDIDNTFRRLLLHAKKKYAAINVVEIDGKLTDKLEVKGLDMRRREYCSLSKETSSKLLNLLLSGEEPETVVEKIHDHLRELAEQMRQFSIPTQKYTIFTQLSKDPKDYPNAKSMPSVQAALRSIAKGRPVRAKDVMAFIITGANGGSSESAATNAFPPDEVLKQNSGLKPDIDYYLHKQILPPVERLCAPITLTNVTRLAECLGLDTSKYRVSTVSGGGISAQEDMMQPLDSQIPDHVRFSNCIPLRFRCLEPKCQKAFSFRSMVDDRGAVSHAGLTCQCGQNLPNLSVVAQLEHQIRALSQKYYDGWLVCDDPSCGIKTRQMSVYGHRCLGPKGLARDCRGRMQWMLSEKTVWNQLVFWERAFDVDRTKERVKTERQSSGISQETHEKISVLADVNRERFETCKGVVRGYLDKNGRQTVSMGSLFEFVR